MILRDQNNTFMSVKSNLSSVSLTASTVLKKTLVSSTLNFTITQKAKITQ